MLKHSMYTYLHQLSTTRNFDCTHLLILNRLLMKIHMF